jgi:hypothetical protein
MPAASPSCSISRQNSVRRSRLDGGARVHRGGRSPSPADPPPAPAAPRGPPPVVAPPSAALDEEDPQSGASHAVPTRVGGCGGERL